MKARQFQLELHEVTILSIEHLKLCLFEFSYQAGILTLLFGKRGVISALVGIYLLLRKHDRNSSFSNISNLKLGIKLGQ